MLRHLPFFLGLVAYYEDYRRYARDHGLPLIDHDRAWQNLREKNEDQFKRWLPDGTHPLPEASRTVTWSGIKALLEQARSASVHGSR